jgi:hypothetical protein
MMDDFQNVKLVVLLIHNRDKVETRVPERVSTHYRLYTILYSL